MHFQQKATFKHISRYNAVIEVIRFTAQSQHTNITFSFSIQETHNCEGRRKCIVHLPNYTTSGKFIGLLACFKFSTFSAQTQRTRDYVHFLIGMLNLL